MPDPGRCRAQDRRLQSEWANEEQGVAEGQTTPRAQSPQLVTAEEAVAARTPAPTGPTQPAPEASKGERVLDCG